MATADDHARRLAAELRLRLVERRLGSPDGHAGEPADAWTATLAVTRPQALRLIQAESFARSVRLLGR